MSKRYTVLITGSSGMLGVDLCEELAPEYDVYGMDLRSDPKRKAQSAKRKVKTQSVKREIIKFYKADITCEERVVWVVKKIKPDFIIHTAAWTDVDGCELDKCKAYEINSKGTNNVVRACSAIGATLIYISTDFVFDGRKKSPYKETDKTHALSVYGDSKLKGERFIEKVLKKNYFVLRTSWLYGKYGKNFADTIIAKAKREKSLKVVTDQVGSPTWTRDLARAIHKLLGIIRSQKSEVRSQKSIICRTQHATRNTRYGIYHITNSGRVSWHEYAEEILKLAKIKATVIPITSAELGRPARRPAMSVMDNSKFIKLTGYEMPSWKQALKNYLSKR